MHERWRKAAFACGSALAGLLLTVGCLGSATPTLVPALTALPTGTAVLPPSATPLPPTVAPTATSAPVPPTATPALGAPSPTPAPTRPTSQPPARPARPSPTPATHNPLLLAALDAMQQVQTYHYTATEETLDNGHHLSAQSEGDYAAPGGLSWTTTNGTITTTAVLTGDQYYVAAGGAAWTRVPQATQERTRQLLWRLIGQAQHVQEVARDPASAPDPAVHLAFDLPFRVLPLDPHPWTLATGDVWLGLTDHRVQAFKLFAQEPLYETTARFFLSAYNVPVRIALPVPSTPAPALGGRLLYLQYDSLGTGAPALHLRDLATGADTVLPGVSGAVDGGALSPDGTQVLYSAANRLYLYDLGKQTAILLGRGTALGWAADGSSVLFVRGGAPGELWISDPLFNAPRRLADLVVAQAGWTPDGTQVLVSGWLPDAAPTAATAQLFAVAVAGGAATRLPPVPGGAAWPRPSPDGTRLALVAGGHLALADPTGHADQVLEPAGQDSAPLWSSDGSQLLYAHRPARGAPRQVLIRPADGGPATLLLPGDDLPLDWQ